MSLTTPQRESRIERDFKRWTKDHRLTVLHEDGLYRHLRVAKPGTYMYGFDVVTWPGYLAIVGDIGDYTFCRINDMLEFFETEHGGINPDYWSQKLQAGAGGDHAGLTRKFSNDKVREVIYDWCQEECSEYGRHGEEAWDEHTAIYPHLLFGAFDRELLSRHFYGERELFEAIDELDRGGWPEFGFDERIGLGFDEPWEYTWTDYAQNFLVCCHAIVLAVRLYREHQEQAEPTAVAA